MFKHFICHKELCVSRDAHCPLSHSLQQSLANATVTPYLLLAKESLLFFDTLLHLNSFL